jgi:hypothetical protein
MDEWFRLHYSSARRANESSEGFSIVREGEFNALRREENAVRFIIGLPESDGRKLKDF